MKKEVEERNGEERGEKEMGWERGEIVKSVYGNILSGCCEETLSFRSLSYTQTHTHSHTDTNA